MHHEKCEENKEKASIPPTSALGMAVCRAGHRAVETVKG